MKARWTTQQFDQSEKTKLEKRLQKPNVKKPAETANRITANIIRVINLQVGCVAYRINNVGVWDAAKQIHRKGATEKGIPDVIAVIRGQFWGIEVKAGRDKMSEDQLKRKFEILKAGGLFFEIRSTDEFVKIFEGFVKDFLNTKP
jgi:hypothetical protein